MDEGMSVIDERLHRLMARGFQFMQATNAAGAPEAVVGVRVHDDVLDVVQLRAENDVVAARMPADEANVLDPAVVLWRSSGHAASVLDELLDVPDGGSARRPSSPTCPGGSAPPSAELPRSVHLEIGERESW